MLEEMREGWDYVRGFHPIRTILLVFSLACLMGYPYSVAAAGVRARETLHGGAHTLGWLSGASGAGALISAFTLAVRQSSAEGLQRMVVAITAVAVLGVALILFGLPHTLWLSLVLMLFAGFGIMQRASRHQHHHSVARAGRQARARRQLLGDGVLRIRAVRQRLLAGLLAHRILARRTTVI